MTDSILKTIVQVAGILSTVLLAWIAYKQAALSKTMNVVKEQTDGINKALVATTAVASKAEGKLEAQQEQKAEDKKNGTTNTK